LVLVEFLRHPTFAALVFFALWLDGSFYPLLLLPLAYVWVSVPDRFSSLGLKHEGFPRSIMWGFLGLGIVLPAWLAVWLAYGGWDASTGGLLGMLRDFAWYPVYEEITYRGFFLSRLGPYLKRKSFANLVQAALFASIHYHYAKAGMPLRILPAFVLGLVTGIIFLKTRNLAGCLLCHALANMLASAILVFLHA
jgi:membrane protease YdiL (CAAX protease family)